MKNMINENELDETEERYRLKKITLATKVRLIEHKIKLLENNKGNTEEFTEIQRKLDLLDYGIDIQSVINNL